MNKLFIGLLIVAAGAGIFSLLRSKRTSTTNNINKEWIIGKWKVQVSNDSNFSKYNYDFQQNGNVFRSLKDSVKADTLHYEWNNNNEMLWKEKPTDSTARVFVINKLTEDSLRFQTKDSAAFVLTKLR